MRKFKGDDLSPDVRAAVVDTVIGAAPSKYLQSKYIAHLQRWVHEYPDISGRKQFVYSDQQLHLLSHLNGYPTEHAGTTGGTQGTRNGKSGPAKFLPNRNIYVHGSRLFSLPVPTVVEHFICIYHNTLKSYTSSTFITSVMYMYLYILPFRTYK